MPCQNLVLMKMKKEALIQFLKEVDLTGYYPNKEAGIENNGWVEIKTSNMKTDKYPLYFIYIGLISLLFGLLCGLLAGFQYIMPNFIKDILPFNALRPLHTLFSVSWILLGAIGEFIIT